ncbi:hypothetical protein LCGC14_1657230, partial [marine sediment metagenome]
LYFATYLSHSGYSVYFDNVKYYWTLQHEFNGITDTNEGIWTFNFNDPLLNGSYQVILEATDNLGYTSTFSDFAIFFDNTILGFFPDTLPNGFLFNGSNLMYIQNSTGLLFNKTLQSLHIFTNSTNGEYTDLGTYYNLLVGFNNLIIDSARISDGEHNITFELIDITNNHYTFTYPIKVDNNPPTIEDISINNLQLGEEVYFNENANLQIYLDDLSEIFSVKIHVLKVLGDPAIYETVGNEKNWSSFTLRRDSSDPSEIYYLNPNNLTYSFNDSWRNGTDDVYQNVLYWNGWNPGIPFIDLNIYDVKEAISPNGESIPFFFDFVTQEITFDERYREYLTDDIILKGVKSDLGWNTSFIFDGNSWVLSNFNVEEYLNSGQHPAWWANLFGFDNDDSANYRHYDHPQKFMRNNFEFYIEIEDIHENVITTQLYQGIFDDLRPEGTFGQIMGSSSNGVNYWTLGKTGDAGNVMFGTSIEEYQTLFFTPGYIKNSTSGSYYVKYGFLFLHNIEKIMLYNASDYYLGEMVFDPLTLPHPTYTFELNAKDFTEGLTYIKAEIIDKAQNNYIILQDLFIIKEGPNTLHNALNFGDIIYYDKNLNYTENPIQFQGYLDNWVSHENKSEITVKISYLDYSEEIWVPMGTTTTTDGNFVIDWHVDNNTYYKLLSHQRGYIPINYTFSQQPNSYFYGSYGFFDDTGIIYPFLVDLSGMVYVYSYNESSHQWFINLTIDLGFSLIGKEISNFDLNKDSYTDLVIFDKFSTASNISLFIFDILTLSYQYNQTILASNIDLPDTLPDATFKDFIFDFENSEFLTMYVCLSDSINSINYIARLDFDSFLTVTQQNDGTQLPALRVISAIVIAGDTLYIGAVNPTSNNRVNSSIFSIDKDLAIDSTVMIENATKGALLELASFKAVISDVIVAGVSMAKYNQDDHVLYYIYDSSLDTWYRTSFSADSEIESYSNEIYDFKIRSLVKFKEGQFESVLISSSKGLWKTFIDTDIITLTSTPTYFGVDTFRKFDLFTYQNMEGTAAVIPLTYFPILEIISVYKFDKYL